MNEISIRPARPGDANGINAVYNPYIKGSAATFETYEYSEAERIRWLAERAESGLHPVLVAVESDGLICGFANAAPFDARGAYQSSVKTSVFVTSEVAGQGVAKRLYGALFETLAITGAHRAYALIVEPNPASIAVHERLGFAHIATLNEVGCKFGLYHNVMWFEKRL